MLGIVLEFSGFHVHDGEGTLAEVQGSADGVLDSLLIPCGGLELVHYELYEMRLVPVKGGDLGKVADFGVYPCLCVSALAELFEELLVVSLAPFHERRKQEAFPFPVVLHDQGYYLLVGVPDHRLSCGRGVCSRCLGIQEPQEIIYFGDGAYSGSRVVAGSLLLDGDDGAESRDALHIRLLKNAHELLCVCG